MAINTYTTETIERVAKEIRDEYCGKGQDLKTAVERALADFAEGDFCRRRLGYEEEVFTYLEILYALDLLRAEVK